MLLNSGVNGGPFEEELLGRRGDAEGDIGAEDMEDDGVGFNHAPFECDGRTPGEDSAGMEHIGTSPRQIVMTVHRLEMTNY